MPASCSVSTARSTAKPLAMPSSAWSQAAQSNSPSVPTRISSARSSTRRVQGSSAACLPARSRAISLELSCALIARCTRSMAAKARSTARTACAPATRISTSVPRSGRARLTLLEVALIHRQHALDAVGHVAARERRAADIADIAVELQRIGGALAGELRAPFGVAHLAAVRFPVLEHLDAAHSSLGIEPHRIADELVPSQPLLEDEPTALRDAPHALAALKWQRREGAAGKQCLLRLFDRQIYPGVGRGHRQDHRCGEKNRPARRHQELRPNLTRHPLRARCSP